MFFLAPLLVAGPLLGQYFFRRSPAELRLAWSVGGVAGYAGVWGLANLIVVPWDGEPVWTVVAVVNSLALLVFGLALSTARKVGLWPGWALLLALNGGSLVGAAAAGAIGSLSIGFMRRHKGSFR